MSASPSPSVVEPVVQPQTLEGLWEQYRRDAQTIRGVLEVSAEAERPYLRRFFDWYGPPDSSAALFEAVSADSVMRGLMRYASEHGPGSRCCMQRTVRLFLRFAHRKGYLKADLSALSPAVRQRRMGKLARAIAPAHIEAVLAGIHGQSPTDLRDRAMLTMLSTYGVRGVQIRRLCLEDVDWSHNRVRFPAAKRGRPVLQALTAKVGNRLAEYLQRGRPACACREVFLSTREPFRPLTAPRQLSKILRQRIERAGVQLPPGVAHGSHCFRHAFATRLYGQVPFKDIVDMLGHRDPSSTLIYGKVDSATLAKAALPWPGGAA